MYLFNKENKLNDNARKLVSATTGGRLFCAD